MTEWEMQPIIKEPALGYAYRYEDVCERDWDPWEERVVGYPRYRIWCNDFPVISETPKGFWIDLSGGICPQINKRFVIDLSGGIYPQINKRFVLKDSQRRYACRTKAEALTSFIARKQAQVRILTGQLERAKAALSLAQEEQRKEAPCTTA